MTFLLVTSPLLIEQPDIDSSFARSLYVRQLFGFAG